MLHSRRYRYPNEQVVLVVTLLLVLGVVILTSTVTFCLSGVFILGMFAISAFLIHSHHQALMRGAFSVNPLQAPELAQRVEDCAVKLQPGAVDVFLVKRNQMNAYTFGIGDPKVLVLYTPLLQIMTPGELKFVIGHEMGHVALGHTWLNTILGGMAGIPAPFGATVLLYAAFRWWNRMCEFSADRAGLLACGDLNLAIAALIKLVAPEVKTQNEFEQALAMLHAERGDVTNRLAETFQTHPMLIRRVNQLRTYSRTPEYQHLQASMNQNLKKSNSLQLSHRTTQPGIENQVAMGEKTPEPSAEERWPWLKRYNSPDSQK